MTEDCSGDYAELTPASKCVELRKAGIQLLRAVMHYTPSASIREVVAKEIEAAVRVALADLTKGQNTPDFP